MNKHLDSIDHLIISISAKHAVLLTDGMRALLRDAMLVAQIECANFIDVLAFSPDEGSDRPAIQKMPAMVEGRRQRYENLRRVSENIREAVDNARATAGLPPRFSADRRPRDIPGTWS